MIKQHDQQPWQPGTALGPHVAPGLLAIVGLLALMLALAPLDILLAVAGLVLAVALPLLHPVFGLYLVILSVPIQQAVVLPGGQTYTQAAVLLAVGAWGLRILAHPERPVFKPWLLLPWIAFLWALLLSTSVTPYSTSEAIRETARWTVAFLAWLLAVTTIDRRWQLIGLVVCLLLAPVAQATIGLVQTVSGAGPPSFRIPGTDFARAYGTIGTPNAFAGYINMAWPLALALAIGTTWNLVQRRAHNTRQPAQDEGQRTEDGRRGVTLLSASHLRFSAPVSPGLQLLLVCLTWIVVGVLLAALLASFSRGSWLGALVGVAGMAIAMGRWAMRAALAGAAVLVLALALGGTGLLPDALATRLASITRSVAFFDPSTVEVNEQNFAVVERAAQLWAGWRMFAEYPLTGVGPGNYDTAYPDVAVAPWYGSRGHAHNYYLHQAGEAGVVGLLAYLALIGAMSYNALSVVRRTNSTFTRATLVGCCGIIAAVAGHNLFENLHVLNMGIQLSGVWALATLVERVERAENSGDDRPPY